MRRLAVCLTLSLALAAPAAAQQGKITVIQPSVSSTALRGSMAPTPRKQDAPPPEVEAGADIGLAPALSPTPVGFADPSGEARQCRTLCSQSYYFCLSGDDDQCPDVWSRCQAGCGG
ncbi:MAG: hypothetical protein Q8L66_05895 [Caulobacter sp.]|nr:hypothetical protein [Caulobacter sp.]